MIYVDAFPVLNTENSQSLLLELDRLTSDHIRARGCQNPQCKATGKVALHDGSFQRKPRGITIICEEFCTRFSSCCQTCRQRVTPPSLRFLSRKIYLGAVVAVTSALRHGVTPARMQRLKDLTGVSRQTVERWVAWWKESLPRTNLWLGRRGALVAVKTEALPLSWLDQAEGSPMDRVLALLRFIAPLTGGLRSGAAM